MPCTCSQIGFRHRHVNPKTGLRKITFNRNEALHPVEEQQVPFGICMHCRLKHSREWGIRVALESTLYPNNSFITLTYRPQKLPPHAFLNYDAPVLFMKRLREEFGSGIRSFGCAEYGEKFSRPHYHICLLNFDFPDKKIIGKSTANFGKNSRENNIFSSEKLTSLWKEGHTAIGALTLESAQYVARYCTKKISGKAASKHYETCDENSGEIFDRPPERAISISRRPGIGFPWYEKFGKYVRDHDKIWLEGRAYPPPKYFDSLTEKIDPDRYEEIKKIRRVNGARSSDKLRADAIRGGVNDFQRMLTIERCQELSFKLLKRGIENGD